MAVLIDATLVRLVLVPATMELLGRANWWLPRWLDRIVPRLTVERRPAAAQSAVAPAGGSPLPPPVGVASPLVPAEAVAADQDPVGAGR